MRNGPELALPSPSSRPPHSPYPSHGPARTTPWIYLIAAAWASYLLGSLLGTGFISDDSYNSMQAGKNLLDGLTPWEHLIDSNLMWIKESGRFFPFAFYEKIIFAYVKSRLAYKAIALCVVVASILSFGAFIERVSRSSKWALACMLAVPLFFQFRAWHDPILAFHFLTPFLTVQLFLSLLTFQIYLEGIPSSPPPRRWLSLSASLFGGTLLTYELAYPCFVFFPLLAWHRTRNLKQALRSSFPHLLLSLCVFSIYALLRVRWINPSYGQGYQGAEIHLVPGAVAETFAIQFSSAFPLSYFLRVHTKFAAFLRMGDYLAFAAFATLATSLLRSLQGHLRLGFLMGFGALCATLPTAVIAISGHQEELMRMGYGYGYLSVYLQYFGMLLILVAPLAFGISRIKTSAAKTLLSALLATTLACVGLVNLGQNRSVAKATHAFYRYPREVLQSALEHGVLDEVPSGATLIRDWRFPFDLSWFYSTHTGRVFDAVFHRDFFREGDYVQEYLRRRYPVFADECHLDDVWNVPSRAQRCRHEPSLPKLPPAYYPEGLTRHRVENTFLVTYQYDRDSGKRGTLYLGKLHHIVFNAQLGQIYQYNVESLKLYDFETHAVRQVDLAGKRLDFQQLFDRSEEPPIPLAQFDPESFRPRSYHMAWTKGFSALDGGPASNVRWCSQTGEWIIANLEAKPIEIAVSMDISSGDPAPADLSIHYPGSTDVLKTSPARAPYRKRLILPPGETRVRFVSKARRFALGDPRDLHFGIHDFHVERAQVVR